MITVIRRSGSSWQGLSILRFLNDYCKAKNKPCIWPIRIKTNNRMSQLQQEAKYITAVKRGKKWSRWQARENMQPVPSARKTRESKVMVVCVSSNWLTKTTTQNQHACSHLQTKTKESTFFYQNRINIFLRYRECWLWCRVGWMFFSKTLCNYRVMNLAYVALILKWSPFQRTPH